MREREKEREAASMLLIVLLSFLLCQPLWVRLKASNEAISTFFFQWLGRVRNFLLSATLLNY